MAQSRPLQMYIGSLKLMDPNMTIPTAIKKVKSFDRYRRKSYDVLYKTIQRAWDRVQKPKQPKPRKRPIRTQDNVKRVKEILKKTRRSRRGSIRGIQSTMKRDYDVDISIASISDILHDDLNKKFVRYRRVQKLTEQHKVDRVKFAKYLTKKYGITQRAKHFGWDKVINTDFSAPFRCRRRLNPQNDGIWVDNDDDIDSQQMKMTVDKGYEKYSKGLMLFGGICSEGLLPRNGPIFFTEWLHKKCQQIGRNKKTLDNKLYAVFIKEKFKPILERDLKGTLDEYIWQDDCDKKHRTEHVLSVMDSIFKQKIDVQQQCVKFADVYPIENIWAILYEKTRGREFKNLDEMKRCIRKIWREIDGKNLQENDAFNSVSMQSCNQSKR